MNLPNIKKFDSSHWYYRNGEPCFELPKKSGDGNKRPTLADARKLGLLPSVTNILNVVHKPNLQDWLIMQAVKAVMETPRQKGESDEAFLERVLVTERIQDLESRTASNRGTEIHKAIELAIQSQPFEEPWRPYVEAVFPVLENLGKIVFTEKIITGDGYAGKCDIGLEGDHHLMIIDFKSTKKLPKESYREHRMQLAAYAGGLGNTGDKMVLTANLYLSTENPGQVCLCPNADWKEDLLRGFLPARDLWCYMNDYRP